MLQYIHVSSKTEKKIVRILKRLRNALLVVIVLCLLMIFNSERVDYHGVAERIPNNTLKYLFFKKLKDNPPRNISQLRAIVSQYNQERNIINEKCFGPITKNTVVFVITVRGFSNYLKFLIVSLAQVDGIDRVLLVFSHTVFDEDVNNLIKSIDFCRVLQIYYPYSTQLYPNEFPGYSPGDCPHNMNMETAQATNCTGSRFPDFHGHFRNPEQVEKKHQWWWTSNVVFENIISHVQDYTGVVVFLKEDLYVLKDFLYMILFMKQISKDLGNIEFITLDCVPHIHTCIKEVSVLEVVNWDHNYEPSVLAFDIKVWNSIVSDYDIFCSVDDSSWARSLPCLSLKREEGSRYKIMTSMFPRSYETSSCGSQNVLRKCNVNKTVQQILEVQRSLNASLFPSHLEVFIHIVDEEDSPPFEYSNHGGWKDPRDREMCANMTMSKIKKIIKQMRREFIKFNEM